MSSAESTNPSVPPASAGNPQNPASPAANTSSSHAANGPEQVAAAPADPGTAKSLLHFVIKEYHDLLRQFREQGAHRKEREVLKDMCHAVGALARLERAEERSQAQRAQPDKIELPELTAEQQELQTKAKVMTPVQRRSVREMLDSVRNILQLEEPLMAKNEVAPAPPESMREGEEAS